MEGIDELIVAIRFFKYLLRITLELQVHFPIHMYTLLCEVMVWTTEPDLAIPSDRFLSVGRTVEHLMSMKVLGSPAEETFFTSLKTHFFHMP